MNYSVNVYNRRVLNKLMGRKVRGGQVLGVKYGFNANSGSIGYFVYVMPGLLFTLLAFVSVLIGLASNYMLSAGEKPASECDLSD